MRPLPSTPTQLPSSQQISHPQTGDQEKSVTQQVSGADAAALQNNQEGDGKRSRGPLVRIKALSRPPLNLNDRAESGDVATQAMPTSPRTLHTASPLNANDISHSLASPNEKLPDTASPVSPRVRITRSATDGKEADSGNQQSPGLITRKPSYLSSPRPPERLLSPRKPSALNLSTPSSPVESQPGEKASSAVSACVPPLSPRSAADKTSLASPFMVSSEPTLTIPDASSKIRVNHPSKLHEKDAEKFKEASMRIVDHFIQCNVNTDHPGKIGDVQGAFYVDNLGNDLKQLLHKFRSAYISSSELLERLFSQEIKSSDGWCTAKTVFTQTIDIIATYNGESNPEFFDSDTQDAIKTKLNGCAEVLVRQLFDSPVSLDVTPLPKNLIHFLIQCDQYFYDQLLSSEKTKHFSHDQMREARSALQNQLLMSYALKPLLEELTQPCKDKLKQWFVTAIMDSAAAQAEIFVQKILKRSFSEAPSELREKFFSRQNPLEKNKRIDEFKNNLPARLSAHSRSRSGDASPIDPMAMRESARRIKQRNKSGGETMQQVQQIPAYKEQSKIGTQKYRPSIDLQDFGNELDSALTELQSLLEKKSSHVIVSISEAQSHRIGTGVTTLTTTMNTTTTETIPVTASLTTATTIVPTESTLTTAPGVSRVSPDTGRPTNAQASDFANQRLG